MSIRIYHVLREIPGFAHVGDMVADDGERIGVTRFYPAEHAILLDAYRSHLDLTRECDKSKSPGRRRPPLQVVRGGAR